MRIISSSKCCQAVGVIMHNWRIDAERQASAATFTTTMMKKSGGRIPSRPQTHIHTRTHSHNQEKNRQRCLIARSMAISIPLSPSVCKWRKRLTWIDAGSTPFRNASQPALLLTRRAVRSWFDPIWGFESKSPHYNTREWLIIHRFLNCPDWHKRGNRYKPVGCCSES